MRLARLAGIVLAILYGMGAMAFVSAQGRAQITPSELAAAIERRAQQSNFASLEKFADDARRLSGRERLARLNHAAGIFLNQSEFDRFEKWNNQLGAFALADHNQRYIEVARINALVEKLNNGDRSVVPVFERYARSDPDWYVRVHAMANQAFAEIASKDAGSALKHLSEAGGLVKERDPDAMSARSEIWEAVGLALLSLYDMQGSADALARAEIDYSNPAYPHPDFDAVYNMTRLAVQMGDAPLAQRLAAVHHRLAQRADLPHLAVWDKGLCASVAESFGQPQQTIDCFKGLQPNLADAAFLAPRLLSSRAVALARLHRVDEAQADLAQLRHLKASGQFDATAFEREPQIEAELLAAQGRPDRALSVMRGYMASSTTTNAAHFNSGVHQITSQLEEQLGALQRNEELNERIIYFQWAVGVLGGMILAGGVFLLIRQRSLSRQFREAKLRADAANRAKSDFLANISHEIRTPLNGVLGMAQAIAADELPQRQRARLEVISQSGAALLTILNDLLDLSKIEAGRMDLEQVDFDLAELARGVRAAFEPLIEQKGLYLTIDIAPGAAGCYRGDPTRVRQILDNLISNAIKFTQNGGVTVQISRPAEVVRFVVQDTGIGMSAEAAARIFSKFEQADISTTRRFGGTGLGLSICKQLSAAMGGDITVWSETGQGSAFTVTLPLSRVASAEAGEAAVASASPLQAGPDQRRIRVLAAEDNLTNQLVVKTLMMQGGCDTTVVADGRAAVHAYETGEYDLVLMDIQMPEMDGVEATRRIRQFEQAVGRYRTPVIALTANAMAHQVGEYLSAGFDDHVAKPIEAAVLFAAVNAALMRREEAEASARRA